MHSHGLAGDHSLGVEPRYLRKGSCACLTAQSSYEEFSLMKANQAHADQRWAGLSSAMSTLLTARTATKCHHFGELL